MILDTITYIIIGNFCGDIISSIIQISFGIGANCIGNFDIVFPVSLHILHIRHNTPSSEFWQKLTSLRNRHNPAQDGINHNSVYVMPIYSI